MAQPKALVLCGDGINCDYETSWALERAGFKPERLVGSVLLNQPQALLDYQLCVIPGGFSYGDEIASGKVLAVKLKERLSEQLYQFVSQDRLLLGICNGFQVLVQLGLLPHAQPGQPRVVSLLRNAQRQFLNRWVALAVDSTVKTPFFAGLESIELPIRHGEGRIALGCGHEQAGGVGAFGTATDHSLIDLVKSRAPLRYKEDVNGSFDRIAALTDATGHVMGLMPHPEAFVRLTQHPAWTSRKLSGTGNVEPDGLRIFANAAKYFA